MSTSNSVSLTNINTQTSSTSGFTESFIGPGGTDTATAKITGTDGQPLPTSTGRGWSSLISVGELLIDKKHLVRVEGTSNDAAVLSSRSWWGVVTSVIAISLGTLL